MEKFFIEGREFVPRIDFNPATNVLTISGESYHEYTHEFFEPIFSWVEHYAQEPKESVELNFKMSYFNTASSKCFYEIIEMLSRGNQDQLIVNWYYEEGDLDMRETGEEYAEESGVEINLIPYKPVRV